MTSGEPVAGVPSDITFVEASPAAVAAANAAPGLGMDAGFDGRGPWPADRVGPGDVLAITVFENVATPLLGAAGAGPMPLPPMQVDQKGEIFLPYAGNIRAAGMTVSELRQAITEALADQTPDPQVVVVRTPGNASAVTVAGTVARQGLIPLDAQVDRLSTLIAAAGGSTARPEDTVVTLIRGDREAEVRLDELLLGSRRDVVLRPGDRIVLREDRRSISVFGAAGAQGQLDFAGTSYSLTDALAAAGGFNGARAYPKGVFVFRDLPAPAGRRQTVYHFDMGQVEGAFLAGRFTMRDEDILYVSEAPFSNFSRVLDAIRGTTAAGETLARTGQ